MQWQPIETAPKDETEILLFCSAGPLSDMGLCYWRDDEQMTGWTWGAGNRFNNPTHWMPLPAPPDTQRTDPPNCDWHRDEFGNWFSGCSETMPDFTPWKGTDPKGSFCPKCGKIITVRVHDKP